MEKSKDGSEVGGADIEGLVKYGACRKCNGSGKMLDGSDCPACIEVMEVND